MITGIFFIVRELYWGKLLTKIVNEFAEVNFTSEEMKLSPHNSICETKLESIENREDPSLLSLILSLNLESIKLLKIEAEGAEPEVLQGSIQTIRKCDYIVVDSGKERGRNFEETTMSVCNLLIKNNFDLIYIDHIRIVLMFRNAIKEEI